MLYNHYILNKAGGGKGKTYTEVKACPHVQSLRLKRDV